MGNQVTRHSFHIAEILKDLKQRISAATGLEVYIGSRPTSVKESLKEFAVIDMPYSVSNRGAYQTTSVEIQVLVKDKSQGASNIARLDELSNSVVGIFPLKGLNGRYLVGDLSLKLQGKDNIGYTVWNLWGRITINKTDTY